MKNKIIAAIGAGALIALIAGPAIGATEAGVSATVTAQLVAVSVTDGVVTYGTLEPNTQKDTTLATGTDDTQTAANDGNVNIDLGIRSSDATSGGTNWNLAAAAGTDAFTHEFSTNSGGVWTGFNVDNTTNSVLASNVATSQTFDLRLGTPTVSTDSVEHTVAVTVQASAS